MLLKEALPQETLKTLRDAFKLRIDLPEERKLLQEAAQTIAAFKAFRTAVYRQEAEKPAAYAHARRALKRAGLRLPRRLFAKAVRTAAEEVEFQIAFGSLRPPTKEKQGGKDNGLHALLAATKTYSQRNV